MTAALLCRRSSAPPEAGEPLANVLVSNDNLQQWTASIAAADLTDGHAFISFPAINYEQQGEGEGFQNDVGRPLLPHHRGRR